MDFDTQVKLSIYEFIAKQTVMPGSDEVARTLGTSTTEVEAAFTRLGTKRLLVLEPGSSAKIRMAPPFSGIETPFPVIAGDRSFYANCVWDALGIAAALHADAVVNASDAHTGEAITLEVQNSKPLPHDCVAHFAVPAAQWWDDIIHT